MTLQRPEGMSASASDTRTGAAGIVPLTIIYLALPQIIFLLTWLNAWVGIPAALIVAACCATFLAARDSAPSLDRRTSVFVFLFALLCTVLSGAGGLLPQCQGEDYIKHNLLFHDLVHRDWPVIYDVPGGGKDFLCYSLGYYLVPALIARWFGEGFLPGATFVWTFLGIWLFFRWVAAFHRHAPIRFLLLFVFYAGLGITWFFIKNHGFRQETDNLGMTISYPDWWTKVSFAPQHALAALLGAAALFQRTRLDRNPRGALFLWALIFLWSPFTPLGLIVIPLVALTQLGFRGFMEPINMIGGGTLLLLVGIYYKAHLQLAESGWIWSHQGASHWVLLYVAFGLVQVLVPVACVAVIDRNDETLKKLGPLFFTSAVLLLLLPLYKVGHNNDLRLQVSGPLLVFISLGVASCLTSPAFSLRRARYVLLLGVYIVGSLYPITLPLSAVAFSTHDYTYEHTRRSLGMNDLSQFHLTQFDAAAQYLGKTDSPAYRYLLKH